MILHKSSLFISLPVKSDIGGRGGIAQKLRNEERKSKMAEEQQHERGEFKTTRLPLFYGSDKDDVTPRDFVER